MGEVNGGRPFGNDGRAIENYGRGRPLGGRKNTPERMRYFLNKLLEIANVTRACGLSGIAYPTLRYWLEKSENGTAGDGYDLEYAGDMKRFHQHYYDTRDAAIQMVEDAYVDRAIRGYYEVLSDNGRVVYQIDPELDALGFEGPDAYLRDDEGRPIPERILHQDPEVQLQVLRAWRRDKYGAREQVDVTVRGGVMVVGARLKDPKEIEKMEQQLLAPIEVEFREVEDD